MIETHIILNLPIYGSMENFKLCPRWVKRVREEESNDQHWSQAPKSSHSSRELLIYEGRRRYDFVMVI